MRDEKGRPEYHYVLIDYLCKENGGELQASSDASHAEWVRRKDLTGYRLTEGTLEVIEKSLPAAIQIVMNITKCGYPGI